MEKKKRRRAVVLALIAFFCTATATYVVADWRRFSGGVLAFFKGGRQDEAGRLAEAAASTRVAYAHTEQAPAPIPHDGPPQLAAAPIAHAKRVAGAAGKKPEDDLFVYGDPAAGKPGSFLVASNDTGPAPGTATIGDVPLPGTGTPSSSSAGTAPAGGAGDPGFSAPNPGAAGGSGDNGLTTTTNTTTPSAPTPTPSASPPADSPPASTPTQSGSTDTTPPAPVSSVPEASSAAMMTLAALFMAAAAQAQRRRKQREDAGTV